MGLEGMGIEGMGLEGMGLQARGMGLSEGCVAVAVGWGFKALGLRGWA
jgi:hypothetical protein